MSRLDISLPTVTLRYVACLFLLVASFGWRFVLVPRHSINVHVLSTTEALTPDTHSQPASVCRACEENTTMFRRRRVGFNLISSPAALTIRLSRRVPGRVLCERV